MADSKSIQMNRRTLVGGLGGALAGIAIESASALAAKTRGAANLNPPVVQVKSGKLRGFRDGRTVMVWMQGGGFTNGRKVYDRARGGEAGSGDHRVHLRRLCGLEQPAEQD
jgi:hypothetical protein